MGFDGIHPPTRTAPCPDESTPVTASTTRRDPLCRLLQVVIALQSDRRPNAGQLAEEVGVSRRTIFRDLETIEKAGLRVEYDAARQGYRIASGPPAARGILEEPRGPRADRPGERGGRPRPLRPGGGREVGPAQARRRAAREGEAAGRGRRPGDARRVIAAARRGTAGRLRPPARRGRARGPRPSEAPRPRTGVRGDARGPLSAGRGPRRVVRDRAVVAPSGGPTDPAGAGRVGRADRRPGAGPASVSVGSMVRTERTGRARDGSAGGRPEEFRVGWPWSSLSEPRRVKLRPSRRGSPRLDPGHPEGRPSGFGREARSPRRPFRRLGG